MHCFIYTTIFVLGLIIGSFINCLTYRLKNKISISGRSFCPHCKKQINWYDNIPLLSYFFLKGKCRWCKQPISIQYPLVELISGIFFLIVAIVAVQQLNTYSTLPQIFNFSTAGLLILFRNWVFTAILTIIFIYDLKYYLILDKITIPAMLIALLLNVIINLAQHNSLLSNSSFLVSALIAGGFFFLQFLISKGKWIGGGDIRLGLLMGFMLGWPNILVALIISYILGSLIGIILIIAKKADMKSKVPLGPFLTIGTFIALLWGQQIINWYLNFSY